MENLQESSLSRIHSKIQKHATGGISAFRGDKVKQENKENNKKLLASLLSSGFSVTKVKGSYVETYEKKKDASKVYFFVVNDKIDGDDNGKLEEDLVKFGKKFNQDSILSVRKKVATLIGTTKRETAVPAFNRSLKLGKFNMINLPNKDVDAEKTETLQESTMSRFYEKAKNHAVGSIAAYQSDKTKEENMENNKKLFNMLVSAGYSVTKVKGHFLDNYEVKQEIGEESFFVVNDKIDGDDKGELEKELIRLGKFFDQDSILSVRFQQPAVLIGTSKREDSFPDFGEKVEVGKLKMGEALGQFFSRVKGRKFAFESVEEIERPETYFGKWAMAMMAKNLNEEIDSLT